MEQIEGKNYLTIAEIMERLKVCRQTVMKYKKDKKVTRVYLFLNQRKINNFGKK